MYANLVHKLSRDLTVKNRSYTGSGELLDTEFNGRDEEVRKFIGSAELFAEMVDKYISDYEKIGAGVDNEIYQNFSLVKNPKIKTDYVSDESKLRKYLKSSRDEIDIEDDIAKDKPEGYSVFDIATPISKYILNK